ncbi:MAG: hypothetical protein IRZ08_08990, partial [Frankia sp.]|nr:hypothetical protein [Frankia sp.]
LGLSGGLAGLGGSWDGWGGLAALAARAGLPTFGPLVMPPLGPIG